MKHYNKERTFSKKKKNVQNEAPYFKKKYVSLFGTNSFDKLLQAQNDYHFNQFIRINETYSSLKKVEKFFKDENVLFSKTALPNCLKIEKSRFSLAATPEHLLGYFYLQNMPSQVPALTIDWESLFQKSANTPLSILDMCASPGSKTTQICDILTSKKIPYSLTALEPQRTRFTRFINNIQKQHFKHINLLEWKGELFRTSEKFDVILVDAPCSGNLVGDKYWLTKRNQKGIYENSDLQKKLLENASKLVKKDGFIIYSTCSLEVEENEENVHFAIKKLGLTTQKIPLELGFDTTPLKGNKGGQFDSGVKNAIRFMPYISKTEGFFVCLFKK